MPINAAFRSTVLTYFTQNDFTNNMADDGKMNSQFAKLVKRRICLWRQRHLQNERRNDYLSSGIMFPTAVFLADNSENIGIKFRSFRRENYVQLIPPTPSHYFRFPNSPSTNDFVNVRTHFTSQGRSHVWVFWDKTHSEIFHPWRLYLLVTSYPS